MSTMTLNISDIQRRMKEKVLPLVEMGEKIIVEDAKSHEKKFMIVPISPDNVKWPDFTKRAKSVKGGDLTEVLYDERNDY